MPKSTLVPNASVEQPKYKLLAISLDGKLGLKKSGDLKVQIINLADDRVIHDIELPYNKAVFQGPDRYILIAAFSTDAKHVLFGNFYWIGQPRQYNVCFNVATGKRVYPEYYFNNLDDDSLNDPCEISYSHDGQFLVSAHSNNKTVVLTDVNTGKLRSVLCSQDDVPDQAFSDFVVRKCYFSPSNQYLVVHLEEQQKQTKYNSDFFRSVFRKSVMIFNVLSGKKIFSRNHFSSSLLTVEFSPKEKSCLVSSENIFSKASEWQLIHTKSGGILTSGNGTKPLAFTSQFIVNGAGSDLIIMDLPQQNRTFSYQLYAPTKATFSPNEKFLAVELTDNKDNTIAGTVLYRMADGAKLFHCAAFEHKFSEDSSTIYLLSPHMWRPHNFYERYILRQFQTADGKECASKKLEGPRLSSWIKTVLPDGRVVIDDSHQSCVEELNESQSVEHVRIARPK